jgi:signal transduction histidine kinase
MAKLSLFSPLKQVAHKRRRIILLFMAGIVLPSVLLGYLALRGIQNDRALLEKESLDESRRIAGQVVREVDEIIATVEADFAATVADLVAVGEEGPESTTTLAEFKAGHAVVEEVLFVRDLRSVHFPLAKLLYLADSRPLPAPETPRSSSPSSPSTIQRAQDLEFRRKDYPQALVSYLEILSQTKDPQLEGEILNAVARVQKKAALLLEAIATYERIVRDCSNVISSAGIPLGAAARLELGSLYQAAGEADKSWKTLTGLYAALLRSEWPLKRAEFEFFLERTKKGLEGFLSSPPPGLDAASLRGDFENLESEEREARNRTERMIAFKEGAPPGLEARIGGTAAESERSPLRLILDIGQFSYMVSIGRRRSSDANPREAIWGIILDSERLREAVLRPALLRQGSTRERSWAVKGRGGEMLLASDPAPLGTASVRTGFDSNFPDWTLEFQQKPPDLVKTFLLSRRGVYAYMFILIAGILIFGLVLTIRTVSRELELAKLKSDFVSTISHEFKSPLTSIRQLAEMLHSGRVPSEDRRQKYYDVLLEQSERLSLLTDNILNLARIEEGRKEFRFEPTDLAALLRETVSSVQDRVRHEGFDISVEAESAGSLIVAVDREAVSQALANLLDNAVKYSGKSRKVIVRLSPENEAAVIAVQDFGVGIGKDELDKVFDRFYRGGDALTRTVKGTGLGLSLVKEIVEAHDGRVHVESAPGEGSTFSIRLPLSRTKED